MNKLLKYLCVLEFLRSVMNMDSKTLVQLEKSTVEKLKRLGSKSETYDQIVNKLIDFFEEREEKKREH